MSARGKRKPSWHFDTADIHINQHPSVRKLTPLEKCYMLAVEHGDLNTTRRILEKVSRGEVQSMDINCVDPLGRSALLTAIDNENLEMLELLLLHGVQLKDALLHAVKVEFVEAIELLLEHEECNKKDGKNSWERVDPDSATFPPEISPLMLAAHTDNYEIVKILLDNGAMMPMPHELKCKCDECLVAVNEDCLRHSRTRINAYRALSSPSLICLTSLDPILTAFELSWELRRLSVLENEFKEDYSALRQKCQDFGMALLDHVRTSDELEVILNHTSDVVSEEQKQDETPLARIELALKYQQKKFVAHPNVQQLLSSLWYDGLPSFRKLNVFQQLWKIIKIGVLFPFYSCVYMLCPTSSIGKLMEKPFVKFILHAFSYLFFLFLLILASQRVETLIVQLFGTEEMKLEMTESLQKQRGRLPSIIEMSIILYVVAHVWEETRELWRYGVMGYFVNMWNFIDFTRNTLYISTILLRGWAYIQAQAEISKNPDAVYIPREEWDTFDPTLIADGLFAAGNIFAALKLVHLFSINPYLGPVQISLGRMVIDIVKFFFIYTLVLFAFACGLNQLLWYYADMEKQKCYSTQDGTANWEKHRDSCLAWRRFSNLFESSQSLFWASFGLIDLSNFELAGIKGYTRFWGMLMFGSYSVINVVVLLNLLIAMMSNSYHIISERADTEWKFARTKLFMDYFEKGNTVPPPFNILPTMKIFLRMFTSKHVGESDDSTLAKESPKGIENGYQSVMRNLVWRYVTSQQRSAEDHSVTEDDIKEVRQDISAFRYDLMDVLRGSGMNTPCVRLNKAEAAGKKSKIRQRRLLKDFSITLAEGGVDISSEQRVTDRKARKAAGLGTSANTAQKWRELIQVTHRSRDIPIQLTRNESWRGLLEGDMDLESFANSAMDLRGSEEESDKQESEDSQIKITIAHAEGGITDEGSPEVSPQPILTDEALDQLFTFDSVGETPDDIRDNTGNFTQIQGTSQSGTQTSDVSLTPEFPFTHCQPEKDRAITVITSGTKSTEATVADAEVTSTSHPKDASDSQMVTHTTIDIAPSQTAPSRQDIQGSLNNKDICQTASSFKFGWI